VDGSKNLVDRRHLGLAAEQALQLAYPPFQLTDPVRADATAAMERRKLAA
jgi:hypothetical protein